MYLIIFFTEFSAKCKSFNLIGERQLEDVDEGRSGNFERVPSRLVHSEEDMDLEDDSHDLKSAVAKFKKLSLMKFKVWS